MLNPILYTEKIVSDFLKYQLTAYPFADSHLYEQMRQLLNLEKTRHTPLFKGPYISLSRSFREGAKISTLVREGLLHPHLSQIAAYPTLYGHQETAIRTIVQGNPTLVSTGTGSGKTECFLYPIISHCLDLRDENALPGIAAVIVYPMNALAEDQLGRLRELLCGSGISFGMYVGKTPEKTAGATGKRLKPGASRLDYHKALTKSQQEKQSTAIYPPEERVSREEMRKSPPRILLTNVNQLELLLTRGRDVELFNHARLDYLVFDEAHTFSGAAGAETACLIRRLRSFCGKNADETTCIATSATIADREQGVNAGKDFAVRFFGVDASQVVLVQEEYQQDDWHSQRHLPPPLPGNPVVQLGNVLDALDDSPKGGIPIHAVFQEMTGEALAAKNWQESLYTSLARNELVYQLAQALNTPRLLSELVADLQRRSDRPISEEEILAWLALGASSRKDHRPLLRPVIHGFIRGVGGAVVTFPFQNGRPKLWLSAEDAASAEVGDGLFRLPVTTCTTCGQHYFTHHVGDFKFVDKQPEGGQLTEHRVIWKPLSAELGGDRVILLDKLVTDDDEDPQNNSSAPSSTVPLYFCRHCGTLHDLFCDRCRGCGQVGGLITLLAVRQKSKYPGKLTSCVTCQALGRYGVGGYREPMRSVRGVTVSDVHVLAQNAIQYAERRRLLVFADNRQDAAFQSGWMRDRARRFRFRSLMYDRIKSGDVSIGDLTAYLDDLLDQDDELSRTLIPEVWQVERKEAAGQKHRQERKYFLRIAVLREVATGVKQRIGLEPWGRMKINYLGLNPDLDLVQTWSRVMQISPEELVEGIASLLDVSRRGNILFDPEGRIFSRFWQEGDREIQRGYLPLLQGVPKGLKLQREPGDKETRVQQWLSAKGDTLARQVARNWGLNKETIPQFYEQLWELLTEQLKILVPVSLLSSRNQPISGCSGVYQIDTDKIHLTPHQGIYRCQVCRRTHIRPTPKLTCMAWRCSGTLKYEEENPDDYDLMVLDQQFTTVRAREHSAQVPATEREDLERLFKGEGEAVNTLVCTPTLEMGVDIGGLDAVLMRNVPPLPANYWQRAGRAGRRHRMAVNLTYARQASHDRAYFKDPLKLLQGAIVPPRFNLRNPLMVEKHVHATVLTILHQLRRGHGNLTQGDRQEIADILKTCFPTQVKPYLFDENGHVRQVPLAVDSLSHLIAKHQPILLETVSQVFSQQWPKESAGVVATDKLRDYILHTGDRLTEIIDRLWKRLQWSLDQMARLDTIRQRKGTLDPDEEALRQRCDRLVKKLKGIQSRRKREREGYDDINTYSVLAAEGFLPGYGLEVGSVLGVAQVPRHLIGLSDFELPRPSATALREYVPGNLIYANGHRFVPRFYHLEPQQQLTLFQVDVTHEAIVEVGVATGGLSSLSAASLRAVPICDVDLPHQSHITDEEDYRFQMAVSIIGSEQNRHSGGKAYQWGPKNLLLRQGVHLRLVNVGAANLVSAGNLGYPVCTVCGQTRSPLSSEADRDKFAKDHQERCGQPVEPTGFFADIVVDALTIQDCANRQEAYSIAEALRFGAANLLEMELDDLQVLAIAYPGQDKVDAIIYDPMPGGSGLLDQICDRWTDVTSAALEIIVRCPSVCDTACIDCLFTYRNAYYHRHLNRHLATETINEWGHELHFTHDIPPKLPNLEETSGEKPVNNPETLLRDMLQRAGFPTPAAQHPIDLGRPLGTTTPDFFYEDPTERFEGISIYLDGMSRHLHGDPDRQKRDQEIREQLRYEGYEVIEIPVGNLNDKGAMAKVFFRLGQILLGKVAAKRLKETIDLWFTSGSSPEIAAEFVATLPLPLNLDLTLFDDRWHPFLQKLGATGVAIVPGGDVVNPSSQHIIGSYVVEVSYQGTPLRLLDIDDPDYQAVRDSFKQQNIPTWEINPMELAQVEQVLRKLGHPGVK
ncbi:DEAD/DEAH box helicase [Laspinema olomoucense]|uniref:DEAD/DEAH box helicase n=1 Tax=Laspinema olomoucense TaxID=3231600 RepID=UPI0021BAF1B9|nr:DEAD/DEAH box helicase [Laspinema sp. D3d]MCT7973671.1 DEAD/DEAH box helicase [Laspinema sp. D3d]